MPNLKIKNGQIVNDTYNLSIFKKVKNIFLFQIIHLTYLRTEI
jgi:hypothetical protein